MSLSICIDHDETFTADREAWTKVIGILRAAGHDVFCITLRFPDFPISGFPGVVHYACGQHKWEYAEQNGIHVDIWIDDWPAIIGDRSDRKGVLPPQYAQRQEILRQLWGQVLPQLKGAA